MSAIEEAAMVLGGSEDESEPRKPMQLSDSGTTESENSTKLEPNTSATLLVADNGVAIRFALKGSSGASDVVSSSSRKLGAGQRFDWHVQGGLTDFVYVEAADGSSSYDAHVWTSGPGQG